MNYSGDTRLLVNVLGYGTMLLGLVLIWFRTQKEQEPGLSLKLFGYTFLAMFRFSINQLALPLGLVIAIFLLKRTQINKLAKQRAVWLGAILFLVGLLPMADWVENALHPRTQMSTYLNEDLTGKGFNLHVASPDQQLFYSVNEKDVRGRLIYEALRQSVYQKGVPLDIRSEEEYEMQLFQDTDQAKEGFRKLDFLVASDGSYVKLRYEGRTYAFVTTPEFQRLIREVFAEKE
ncbi:hypothetical protein NDK47_22990 [Brevibacillus ruminantium]|uniref:Uncharacterized protein n=1 Tax=Brevibacillus ruminantium TaxID=2950604 RepID=A0ABY4WDI9_9BACL|nr:hypothetical protein [Brevibacillus ruminantium]USG64959.1 hypothetical protein NDK47_22990 [Brevibacillus ruminantium]